jgi:hypothetical protein
VACTSNANCRDGYACNLTLGVCSGAAKACTITNDCGGASTVCVGGVCVPRTNPDGGACATAGDVQVENGCVPNQAATFTCATDGVQDACAAGSICLHHSCWISCSAADGGANQTTCDSLSEFPLCKPVTSASVTYYVCGSSQNLGGQCDPTTTPPEPCSGADICIDGFCE